MQHEGRGPSPVVAPPPPPPPTPPGGEGRSRRAFVPRRDRVSAWPKVLHSVNERGQHANIRVSQTWGKAHMDARAICVHHGRSCTLTRSCRDDRPLGKLWAWLDYGLIASSHEDHKAFQPSLEQRHCFYLLCCTRVRVRNTYLYLL